MLPSFTVTRTSEDTLSEQIWRFTVLDRGNEIQVIVDEYCVKARATKRHKMAPTETCYARLFSNLTRRSTITEDEIPLPPDVLEEARLNIIGRIKVGRWERDFKRD